MKKPAETLHRISLEGDWTLFLDRDGVLNRKIENGYVMSVDQFEFLPGVTRALSILQRHFKYLFIVTNQQCVGRGDLTIEELQVIHSHMITAIEKTGGRITDIFVATSLESEGDSDRKPGRGMADKAVSKYPTTNLEKSFMVGDTATDMLFGKSAGMVTVFIGDRAKVDSKLADYCFNSLLEFALSPIFQAD